MGLRFRRRFKLFPGVTLNVSKSGVSASVGVPGLHETFGHGKTRTTVGLPGSGLSYTTTAENSSTNSTGASRPRTHWPLWLLVVAVLVLISFVLRSPV